MAATVLVLLGAPGLAHAQMQKELNEEYAKQVKTAEAIATLGNDLFGEQVNLYTGTTEFTVTDVSLRGNNALPVEVRRSFAVQMRDGYHSQGSFADWELDIPYLSGMFEYKNGTDVGWQVTTGSPYNRCTVTDYNFAPPPEGQASGPISGNDFFAEEFWAGNSLHVPGGGDQEMLVLDSGNPHRPTDGATYYWVTSGNWFFSCLTSTANGVAGQGFLARSPDGTTYRFDHIIKRSASSLIKRLAGSGRAANESDEGSDQGEAAGNVQQRAPNDAILRRQEVRIQPTLVTDRFGNTVTYTYASTSSGNVTQIASSDNRTITLTYGTNGVSTVTADGRTWTYAYTTTTSTGLSSVTLPDGSQWLYNLTAPRQVYIGYLPETSTCESAGSMGGAGGTGTITHPSGAVGTFAFGWTRHGRSYVPNDCYSAGMNDLRVATIPQTFDVPALLSKQISGPGIPTANWTYSYSAAAGSWLQNCPLPTSCVRTKTVTVTGPGDWSRYTFGTKVMEDEGKLLKTERGNSATDILRVDATTYQTSSAGQLYPAMIGENPNRRSDGTSQKYSPERKKVTTQQGRNFTWEVPAVCGTNGTTGTQLCFDIRARPTKVVKSSAPAP